MKRVTPLDLSLAISVLFACSILSACTNEATNSFVADNQTDTRVDDWRDVTEDAGADPNLDPPTDPINEPDANVDSGDAGSDNNNDAGGDSEDASGDGDAEPDPVPAFSFAVFGDSQFSVSSCTSGSEERLSVPQLVLDLDPTLLLQTGDLMDHGYEDGAYDHFVGCYDEMLATIPFFPTGGNHDYGSGGITRYKTFLEEQLFERNQLVFPCSYDDNFTVYYEDDPTDWSTDRDNPSDRPLLPSGVTWKTYYAFRFQNALFISFEQGTRWWTQTPKPWLEQHLSAAAADPTIDHIFVYMHHPMYSAAMAESSDGECIEPVRRHYEELFRQYDVDIVFSGHVHSYDRFYVPDDGTPTRQSPPQQVYPNDGSGVHYIVTGGGGGALTGGCDPFPLREELSYQYSQARGCFHHVTHVEIEGGRLSVAIVSVDGGEADYVTAVEDTFVIE